MYLVFPDLPSNKRRTGGREPGYQKPLDLGLLKRVFDGLSLHDALVTQKRNGQQQTGPGSNARGAEPPLGRAFVKHASYTAGTGRGGPMAAYAASMYDGKTWEDMWDLMCDIHRAATLVLSEDNFPILQIVCKTSDTMKVRIKQTLFMMAAMQFVLEPLVVDMMHTYNWDVYECVSEFATRLFYAVCSSQPLLHVLLQMLGVQAGCCHHAGKHCICTAMGFPLPFWIEPGIPDHDCMWNVQESQRHYTCRECMPCASGFGVWGILSVFGKGRMLDTMFRQLQGLCEVVWNEVNVTSCEDMAKRFTHVSDGADHFFQHVRDEFVAVYNLCMDRRFPSGLFVQSFPREAAEGGESHGEVVGMDIVASTAEWDSDLAQLLEDEGQEDGGKDDTQMCADEQEEAWYNSSLGWLACNKQEDQRI